MLYVWVFGVGPWLGVLRTPVILKVYVISVLTFSTVPVREYLAQTRKQINTYEGQGWKTLNVAFFFFLN